MDLDIFVHIVTHDQLYVALSCTTTSNEIVVMLPSNNVGSKQITLYTMKTYWNKVGSFAKSTNMNIFSPNINSLVISPTKQSSATLDLIFLRFLFFFSLCIGHHESDYDSQIACKNGKNVTYG